MFNFLWKNKNKTIDRLKPPISSSCNSCMPCNNTLQFHFNLLLGGFPIPHSIRLHFLQKSVLHIHTPPRFLEKRFNLFTLFVCLFFFFWGFASSNISNWNKLKQTLYCERPRRRRNINLIGLQQATWTHRNDMEKEVFTTCENKQFFYYLHHEKGGRGG